MILDILTQTDFAGAIDATYHCPGAARVAALFARVRAENPAGTLVLDAGDILCGAPITNLTTGEPVVDVYNGLSIDAMTLGNHEFDNGFDTMTRVLARAKFPLLCANILRADTGALLPFAQPYAILERGGVRIGVLGVTTAYTPFMVKRDRFTGYTVLPPAEALNEWIPRVRAMGADVVVVLGHLPGSLENGVLSGEMAEVAAAIPPVDVLIGGHNVGDVAYIKDGTVFAKAGFSAAGIAHIRLTLDENRRIVGRSVRVYDMMGADGASLPPDEATQTTVDCAMAPYRAQLSEPLASLSRRLFADRGGECALGNFYTAALAAAGNAPIGLFNATSLFGFLPAGVVTAEMVTHVMCFDEDVFAGEMTGAQLRALLERTYATAHWAYNGALQFSGLRATVDTRLPEGRRLVSLTLPDGTPVGEKTRYRVATTDYIAMGGNDYTGITDAVAWENTGVRTHRFFVDYLRACGSIPEETDGRMVNLDPAWGG